MFKCLKQSLHLNYQRTHTHTHTQNSLLKLRINQLKQKTFNYLSFKSNLWDDLNWLQSLSRKSATMTSEPLRFLANFNVAPSSLRKMKEVKKWKFKSLLQHSEKKEKLKNEKLKGLRKKFLLPMQQNKILEP